jgi:hypothetical protein
MAFSERLPTMKPKHPSHSEAAVQGTARAAIAGHSCADLKHNGESRTGHELREQVRPGLLKRKVST